jgi:hypothetical protein
MFGKKKPEAFELKAIENGEVPSTGKFRYAIIREGYYQSKKGNCMDILTDKSWQDVGGFWNAEIKDVIAYIEKINSVDYKFGQGETLIRYEIIPVKHESKLTHEYTIGE